MYFRSLSFMLALSLSCSRARVHVICVHRCFLWVPFLSPCPSLSFPFSFPSLTGSEHGKCDGYRVAPISRLLLKIIGLFCKRALQKKLYSAKKTLNFKEPTNRSHPISVSPCTYKHTPWVSRIRIYPHHVFGYTLTKSLATAENQKFSPVSVFQYFKAP